jgi:hypothetical protein
MPTISKLPKKKIPSLEDLESSEQEISKADDFTNTTDQIMQFEMDDLIYPDS